ncbi:hypothetical protein M422DRAFT_239292 [Sphaerobolus stellatus SS14]|nr:hypothetical protein M422DRAFT_239292 [Sphaerobolus stellatus SS14]
MVHAMQTNDAINLGNEDLSISDEEHLVLEGTGADDDGEISVDEDGIDESIDLTSLHQEVDICAGKPSTGNSKVKARSGRHRTHNEQLCVATCGVILGWAMFFGSEALNGVKCKQCGEPWVHKRLLLDPTVPLLPLQFHQLPFQRQYQHHAQIPQYPPQRYPLQYPPQQHMAGPYQQYQQQVPPQQQQSQAPVPLPPPPPQIPAVVELLALMVNAETEPVVVAALREPRMLLAQDKHSECIVTNHRLSLAAPAYHSGQQNAGAAIFHHSQPFAGTSASGRLSGSSTISSVSQVSQPLSSQPTIAADRCTLAQPISQTWLTSFDDSQHQTAQTASIQALVKLQEQQKSKQVYVYCVVWLQSFIWIYSMLHEMLPINPFDEDLYLLMSYQGWLQKVLVMEVALLLIGLRHDIGAKEALDIMRASEEYSTFIFPGGEEDVIQSLGKDVKATAGGSGPALDAQGSSIKVKEEPWLPSFLKILLLMDGQAGTNGAVDFNSGGSGFLQSRAENPDGRGDVRRAHM